MQVGIRELKANLSKWLARVRAGEVVEVTSRRRVVARIEGVPAPAGGGLDDLLAAGEASWQGGKPVGAAVELSAHERTLADTVIEDRG